MFIWSPPPPPSLSHKHTHTLAHACNALSVELLLWFWHEPFFLPIMHQSEGSFRRQNRLGQRTQTQRQWWLLVWGCVCLMFPSQSLCPHWLKGFSATAEPNNQKFKEGVKPTNCCVLLWHLPFTKTTSSPHYYYYYYFNNIPTPFTLVTMLSATTPSSSILSPPSSLHGPCSHF